MFKNMSLAVKLALGFGALVLIAVFLGTMAVINMKSVGASAQILEKENVPEVAVANNVERSSLQTMFEMRGYTMSDDLKAKQRAFECLGKVKAYLKDAKELGGKSPRLIKLKENAERAETKALEYEKIALKTVELKEHLKELQDTLDRNAASYMKQCDDFLDAQQRLLADDLKGTVTSEQVKEKLDKINIVSDLVDMGNWCIQASFKAQALRDTKIIEEAKKYFPLMNGKLDALQKITHDEAGLRQITDCRAAANGYSTALNDFMTTWLDVDQCAVQRREVSAEVVSEAQKTAELGIDDVTRISKEASSSLSSSSSIMITGLLIAVVIAVLLAVVITRGITVPIGRIITALSEGADQTSSAAAQVSSASQQLSQGATEQAASLEETSSSLDELNSMTRQNADSAAKANQLAQEARTGAEGGNKAMQEMQAAMNAINESSDKIAKIIKTIEEIAFQTNLLALNAAVEAARAGEHGKGFAVVAEEVRNLAKRSAQAAKDTASLIEENIDKAKNGTTIAGKVGEALSSIMTNAKKVADIITEISSASKEQSEGISQVTNAVSQMDQVTQQNASAAEETASSSEELSSQAEALKGTVVELQGLVKGAAAVHLEAMSAPVAVHNDRRKPVAMLAHAPQRAKNAVRRADPKANAEPKVVKPEDVIPLDEKDGF